MSKKKKAPPPPPKPQLHMNRHSLHMWHPRGDLGLFVNRKLLSFGFGTHRPQFMRSKDAFLSHVFQVQVRFRPFQMVSFWKKKRILCVGDKPWEGPMGWEQLKQTL